MKTKCSVQVLLVSVAACLSGEMCLAFDVKHANKSTPVNEAGQSRWTMNGDDSPSLDLTDGLYGAAATSSISHQWAMTLGGVNADEAYSLDVTFDGGVVVAGYTESLGVGGRDAWMIKLSESGDVTWEKAYDSGGVDEAYAIHQTADGGYIVVGDAALDFLILRLDAAGNILWQKIYGGGAWDRAHGVLETPDGDFVVVGFTASFGAGIKDVWVLKLDDNGDAIWQYTYGGGGDDRAFSVHLTSDENYVIGGYSRSYGAGYRDLWAFEIDGNGSIVWEKAFIQDSSDYGQFIVPTVGGGYILAGYSSVLKILKLDENAEVVWQKAYGGSSYDTVRCVRQSADGGFIVSGESQSYGSDISNIWLLKLDQFGTIEWQKTYRGSIYNYVNLHPEVQQTADGGYVVAGSTHSFGAGDEDLWIVKMDADGEIAGCNVMEVSNTTETVLSYVASDSAATKQSTSVSAITPSNALVNTIAAVEEVCASTTTFAIPTVSAWGIVVMTLLTLTVGTLALEFRKNRFHPELKH